MALSPRRVIAGAAAAATALAGVAFLWHAGLLRLGQPSRRVYPVRGIDVSHHQGEIDWPILAGQGFAFAYIKATEGADYEDRRFRENWASARGAGLWTGAYHFFTFCRDGAPQAENFLNAVGELAGPMLPPAVDLEFRGNCQRRPTAQELHAELLEFSARVQRKLGLAPVYYVTGEFLDAYGDALPDKPDVWIRSLFFSPGLALGRPWLFWQFASRGRVRGVAGPVDLDTFNGSAQAWLAFLGRRARAR